MKRLAAISLCLIGSVATAAQPAGAPATITISMGDGTVNAGRLKPYDNAFLVTYDLDTGEKLDTGIWSDQLRLRSVNGRQAWVRTQSLASYSGAVLTSINAFDPVTFAPIRTIVIRRDGSREWWTYNGATATGHLRDPKGVETVKTVTSPKPAYDFNCCMLSLLPAALPLEVGKTFVVPSIVASDGDPETQVISVLRRERIHAGHLGMVDTWVVQSHQPNGGTVTFWIADNPRHALRERLENFPTTTCTAVGDEPAPCQAQTATAGIHFNQTFDVLP